MKFIYSVNDVSIEFSIKHYSNSIMQASFKKALIKRNIDINQHLLELGFSLKLCNICKTHHNPNLNLVFEQLENNYVKISKIWYGKLVNDKILYDRFYCYGDNKNCPGIKMNSNSIEYVAATLNLNEVEAKEYIHNNNRSPFYKENHNTLDQYKRSQTRDLSFFINKHGETLGIQKFQKYSNDHRYYTSKQYQIDKFGEDIGIKIWEEISRKKAITLSNLQDKYGTKLGANKYNNWLASVSKSNLELVELHGYDEAMKIISSRNSKRIETLKLSKGVITIPKNQKIEYLIYSQMVWDHTKENILKYGLLKFGDFIKNTKLTIDHMFSIKQGFLNLISPNIIGHIENIEYITKSKNSKKRDNCSIELHQLLENIKNSKYGKL